MKFLFIVLLIAFAAAQSDTFEEWARKYGRVYSSAEETEYRRHVFEATLAEIEELKKESSETGTLFAPNEFADLTAEEFKQNHLCRRPFTWIQKVDLFRRYPVLHRECCQNLK